MEVAMFVKRYKSFEAEAVYPCLIKYNFCN